jgi:CubicO group peptidase (beta-lactamase class C family)
MTLSQSDCRHTGRLRVRAVVLSLISVMAVFHVGAAQAGRNEASPAKLDKELRRIVDGKGPTEPIAAAAVAVMVGDRLIYSGAAGCAADDPERPKKCARAFQPASKFRVASISKMALAMGLKTLVDDGRLDLDKDVSSYLGWKLVNPAFPDAKITARQLLSHTSSIRDPDEYWVAAPGRFRALFEGGAAPFAAPSADADRSPGRWFEYANLNYGILAGIIESISGERFDRFMTEHLFRPLALDIGYNWSGVSTDARSDGAALLSRKDGKWVALVDGPDMLAGETPYFLAAGGLDRNAFLQTYRPGDNPTLFSPQGGLRASVIDLAKLVLVLRDDTLLSTPVWRYDAAHKNGATEDDFFSAFGLGVQTVAGNGALMPGMRLIGHSGEAYGLHSGAWLVKADPSAGRMKDIAFAFVATGVDETPAKGAHPTFNAIEERLVRIALAAAQNERSLYDNEPRPFDETADAMSEVDAALVAAKATGKRPLLILGGNWCHDSRGLAEKFAAAPLRSVIEDNYLPVWVDIGHRDRNLDIARRFGIDDILGTPTVLILSPDGALINRESVHDWRTADSKSMAETVAYFESFADQPH